MRPVDAAHQHLPERRSDLVRRALARVLRRTHLITEARSAESALDLIRRDAHFDGTVSASEVIRAVSGVVSARPRAA
jgi:hypothetical protein